MPQAGPFPTQGRPARQDSGEYPSTRHQRSPVAAALERLTSLDELSIDDHVAVYDAVAP